MASSSSTEGSLRGDGSNTSSWTTQYNKAMEQRRGHIDGFIFLRFREPPLETDYVRYLFGPGSANTYLIVWLLFTLCILLVHGYGHLSGYWAYELDSASTMIWISQVAQLVLAQFLGVAWWLCTRSPASVRWLTFPDTVMSIWSFLFTLTLFGCNASRVGWLYHGSAVDFLRFHGHTCIGGSNEFAAVSEAILLSSLVFVTVVTNITLNIRASRSWVPAVGGLGLYVVSGKAYTQQFGMNFIILTVVLMVSNFLIWKGRRRYEYKDRLLWAQNQVLMLESDELHLRQKASAELKHSAAVGDLLQQIDAELWEGRCVKAESLWKELRSHGWKHESWEVTKSETLKRQSEAAGVSGLYLSSEAFRTLALSRSAKRDPNFYDLKEHFFFGDDAIGKHQICPRDHKAGCALVDTLKPPHRGECTHFLSWTWSYTLYQVRSAIVDWMKLPGPHGNSAFFFMCFFVNNQYRILVDGASVGSDSLETTFHENLRRIGRMVALLDSWDQPTYLTRIWTVYEQHAAYELGVHVDIILPPDASKTLVETIETGRAGVLRVKRSLNRVDSENAKAWDPKDEEAIKTKIRNSIGFKKLNEKVQHHMVAWIGRVIQSYFDTLLKQGKSSTDHIFRQRLSSSLSYIDL